ncbi:unnamed protein product [Arctia plantaginis]|uniref:Uncharacterized protein n=1 Tax=Arctia plantaginis TaxID=874455 RepID=A0A8S1APJ8_ARCPL|nr:unnamed protein product [Arctia plantaginis]
MEIYVRVVTAALVSLAAVNVASAHDRCKFMQEVRRPPRPYFPDENRTGLTWRQQPFLPAFDRDEVCVSEFFSGLLQVIYMEEEIEGDVVLAKFNYHGPEVPKILSSFLRGSKSRLGPVIKRIPENKGAWHLVITQRQDFEMPEMQFYVFRVRVDGEATVPLVSLLIVNIDDNPPIIRVPVPCQIPETAEPGLTNCVYTVTDADGHMSTAFMTFNMDSDRNDEEIFDLDYEVVRGNPFRMNLKLKLKRTLNFTESALHIFRVTAIDSRLNNHTATIMVQVQNIESRPPRWVEIFAMQQFDEKQAMNFTVRALDGDMGIDRPIFYRIETAPEDPFFHIKTFEGGRNGSILSVDPIDRDTLEREVFQFAIIAFKNDDVGNEAFSTRDNILIIVNDINDQKPEPFQAEYNISIMEETAATLNLQNFGFHDRDLGDHAIYTVEIIADGPPGAEAGFQISPSTGYQRRNFILTTLNHHLLDFEDRDFQNITLRIVATDRNNTQFVREAIMNINLINWNDEQPIFYENIQTVTFKETVGRGHFVANVTATDRDIDDRVVHELLGNAGNFLWIDPARGSVYVSVDNAFSYQRQSELFIQVQAVDTLGDGLHHTATSQLVIQLIDVNNTPPSLRLPRARPEVEENVPVGFPIEVEVAEGMPAQEIIAMDPDTDAELVFEIDWTTSYATKRGLETPATEFHNCIEIQTVYPNPQDTSTAVGKLFVKEIRPGVTIDFEEFEILYITVRVIDLKTEIGLNYDEATFTIIVIDMNDNKPLWADLTLAQEFRVRERSDTASSSAQGWPRTSMGLSTTNTREDTPDELAQIDFNTGQITVNTLHKIDADKPATYHLHYTLRASDECYAKHIEDCPPDRTYNYSDCNVPSFIKHVTLEIIIIMFKKHSCELKLGSDSMLPKSKTFWGNVYRKFRKLTQLSMHHPDRSTYYRSYSAVVAERQRLILEAGDRVIHPLSLFSLVWMSIMIFVNLAHMTLSPFRLFYVLEPINDLKLQSTDKRLLVFQILCLTDVFINFNMGYHDKRFSSIILERKSIACRYLKTWLLFDLISCTPIAFFMLWIGIENHRYILGAHILPLFRITRIYTVTSNLKTITKLFSGSYIVIGLVRIPVLLLLSVHWCACLMYLSPVLIYYWTAKLPVDYNFYLQNVGDDVNLMRFSVDYRYGKAIIIVVSAFLGTGYSMFHSSLPDELLVHSCIIVYAAIFMVFTLVFFIKSYLTMYDSTIRYNGLINQVEEYMTYRQFPVKLKKRVRAFYEYRYQQHYFKESNNLQCLSEQLRDEVQLHTSRSLIDKVKLFENISPSTVGTILGCLHPEVYLANDLVIAAGDQGDCMYFISTGTVAAYSANGVEICHLEDGAHFGEGALLMKDHKRPATIVAIENSQLYRMDEEDFSRHIMSHAVLRDRIQSLGSRRMHEIVLVDDAVRKERVKHLSTVNNNLDPSTLCGL